MNAFTHVYGIDVSKDTLDYVNFDTNAQSKEKAQIKNRLKQIEAWVKTLDAQCLCVVEPTGTYSSTLIYLLNKHNIKVAVVGPYKSKSFMDALGVTNKTDDQAAYCLAGNFDVTYDCTGGTAETEAWVISADASSSNEVIIMELHKQQLRVQATITDPNSIELKEVVGGPAGYSISGLGTIEDEGRLSFQYTIIRDVPSDTTVCSVNALRQ